MSHHPAIVGVGAVLAGKRAREIEIAQRQALHEANCAVAVLGRGGDASVYARAAIDAYLTAMRREWKPEAITIGEGDFVVLDVAGARLEVHADVVREADVQVDQSRRWPEWPRAKIKGDGHFYDDAEGERHDIDGLTIYFDDRS